MVSSCELPRFYEFAEIEREGWNSMRWRIAVRLKVPPPRNQAPVFLEERHFETRTED